MSGLFEFFRALIAFGYPPQRPGTPGGVATLDATGKLTASQAAGGAPTGAAGGDLAGTYPNPTVNAVHSQDGTVAAPSHSFANETGSGWFRNAVGDFMFAIGGVSYLRMLANTLIFSVSSKIGFASSNVSNIDTILLRDAANTLAMQNGTNSQRFNYYGTYTNSSNYERGYISVDSINGIVIGHEASGTGTARSVRFSTGGSIRWGIGNANLYPNADNTYDFGNSTQRVRTVYGSGGLVLGTGAKTAAYTTTVNDYTVDCNATSGAFPVTLYATPVVGQIQIIKKTDSSSNAVTVTPNTGQTIDGRSAIGLTRQNMYVVVQWSGTQWGIIGGDYKTPVQTVAGANVTNTTANTLVATDQIPAGTLKIGDLLNLFGIISKNGTGTVAPRVLISDGTNSVQIIGFTSGAGALQIQTGNVLALLAHASQSSASIQNPYTTGFANTLSMLDETKAWSINWWLQQSVSGDSSTLIFRKALLEAI